MGSLIYNTLCLLGPDHVRATAEVVQHHVHRRARRDRVLQHGGRAAAQEARHQPGQGVSHQVQVPDAGEDAHQRLQREVGGQKESNPKHVCIVQCVLGTIGDGQILIRPYSYI